LNYRCIGDVPSVPVAYAYAVITRDRCIIFVDRKKIGSELEQSWNTEGVEVRDYGVKNVGKAVKELTDDAGEKAEVKILGPKECSWDIARTIEPVSQSILIMLS